MDYWRVVGYSSERGSAVNAGALCAVGLRGRDFCCSRRRPAPRLNVTRRRGRANRLFVSFRE